MLTDPMLGSGQDGKEEIKDCLILIGTTREVAVPLLSGKTEFGDR